MRHSTHSSDSSRLRGKFSIPPPEGGASEKLKKGGGSMVLGQVFLKGGPGTFPIWFFEGLWFLHLEITLSFAKLCYAFEEKVFFSTTIIL